MCVLAFGGLPLSFLPAYEFLTIASLCNKNRSQETSRSWRTPSQTHPRHSAPPLAPAANKQPPMPQQAPGTTTPPRTQEKSRSIRRAKPTALGRWNPRMGHMNCVTKRRYGGSRSPPDRPPSPPSAPSLKSHLWCQPLRGRHPPSAAGVPATACSPPQALRSVGVALCVRACVLAFLYLHN